MKEATYLSRERRFPTARPMKLTFIPPISSFFSHCSVWCLCPTECVMRGPAGYSYRADIRGIQYLLLNQHYEPDYTFSGQKAFIPTPAAKQRGYWTQYHLV